MKLKIDKEYGVYFNHSYDYDLIVKGLIIKQNMSVWLNTIGIYKR
jgi:hypothetical protein